MASENYRYKPGGALLTTTVVLLAAGFFLHLVQIPVSGWALSVYQRAEARAIEVGDPLIDEANLMDLVAAGLAIVHFLVLLATAACSLSLIYRAGANANLLSSGLTYSAGWGPGSFFVPFANLVWPYQGMAEYFRASRPRSEGGQPERWRRNATPGFVGLWWGLYLIGSLFGNVALRLSESAEGREDFAMEKTACWLSIVEALFGLGTTATAIWMFRTLFDWQSRRREEMRTERQAGGEVGRTADGGFRLDATCRECGEPVSGDPTECGMCGARRPARRVLDEAPPSDPVPAPPPD